MRGFLTVKGFSKEKAQRQKESNFGREAEGTEQRREERKEMQNFEY
jgi:hypothetical protein